MGDGGAGGRSAGWRTPVGKISVPRPPRALVDRPRCTAALADAVATHRLVVLSAPAGYGKTTLLVSWAATTRGPVAWASLDPLDDDPGRLVRVLADAVALACPEAERELAALHDRAVRTAAHRVDALVTALERLPDDLVVVVDDVHLLSAGTARGVLGPLLRDPGPRFVVAGRHDTALPVNRMRLAGDLGEIRQRTLAFTPEEVAQVVRTLGCASDAPGTQALWEVTRGWPVAVRLALAAGTFGPAGLPGNPLTPLDGLRDRDVPITDYLLEQVIGALPADLADFLLRASIAEQVDPVLAEALVPGGARLLDECAARALFLSEVGDAESGPVYRWHALVAAHARGVLLRRDPSAARAVHRVVAVHLAATDPAAAIRHALHGDDGALAARILGERWPDLLVRGDVGQVPGLRAALPAPYRHDPDVLLALATAQAFAPGTGPGEPGSRARVAGTLVRTFLVPDRPPLGESVRLGREVLASAEAGTDEATLALGLYLVGRAELQRDGAGPDAAQHLGRGVEIAAQRGWVALELGCRAEQALAVAYRGEAAAASRQSRSVLATAAAHDWQRSGVVATAHLARGLAAYWRDELDEAAEALGTAVQCATRTRPEVAVLAAGYLAIACLARGDAAGLARARAVTDAPWPGRSAPEHLTAFRTFLTALQLDAEHRFADALALAESGAGDLAFGDPLALGWESDLRRRLGDHAGAWRALRAARSAAASMMPPSPVHVEVAHRAAAAALLAESDPGAAHGALEAALDIAAPHGVIRPLRDRAAVLHPVLSAHLGWGSAHEDLVARLLVAEQSVPVPRGSAWELTARERDVLTYLRSSLTSDEIAGSLFVSINTVKTHMRAIYRKLGVDGRREAVRVAVRRGLL